MVRHLLSPIDAANGGTEGASSTGAGKEASSDTSSAPIKGKLAKGEVGKTSSRNTRRAGRTLKSALQEESTRALPPHHLYLSLSLLFLFISSSGSL